MTGISAMAKRKRSTPAAQPKSGKNLKQLVITMHASSGEIARIEQLGSSGKRRVVSGKDFVKLACGNDMDDFCQALADAYAAGVRDGFDDAMFDGVSAETGVSHQQQKAQQSAGEQILRSGIGRIALRRVLRRASGRRAATAAHNGTKHAP